MISEKKIFGIVIVIGIVLAFIILYSHKPVHVSFSDNFSELRNVDFWFLSNWDNSWKCDNPANESLVNAAHIKKIGSNYEITCEFGKLYSEIYYQDKNNSYVYLGYIKNCNEQSAKLIDDAIRNGPNCIFYGNSGIQDNMDDYYVFYFGCKKFHLSDVPEPSDYYLDCIKKTQENNPIVYTGFSVILDAKTSIFY